MKNNLFKKKLKYNSNTQPKDVTRIKNEWYEMLIPNNRSDRKDNAVGTTLEDYKQAVNGTYRKMASIDITKEGITETKVVCLEEKTVKDGQLIEIKKYYKGIESNTSTDNKEIE